MEVYNRVLVLLKHARKMGNESSVKRMLMMWLRMDGYDAYLCKSSWDATFRRLGGDYAFFPFFFAWLMSSHIHRHIPLLSV